MYYPLFLIWFFQVSAVMDMKTKSSSVVRQVLQEKLTDGDPRNCPSLPTMQQLLCVTRDIRRKNRPTEPKTFNFELQVRYLIQLIFIYLIRPTY